MINEPLASGHTFIVAELSANHGHDIAIARRSIEAVAECGADGVKLQTYLPKSLTLDVKTDDFLLKGGLWDGRYLYDLYKEALTPYEWHAELFAYARECGLVCFSTPFDTEAVDLLASLDNPVYKIASFEIMHLDLIRYAARQGRPMVLSTGIASEREIEEAIAACREEGNDDITLLKCTSAYPARIEDANIGLIPWMRRRFGVKVGLSDHSPGSIVPVTATALGAVMVEKHFILDRAIGGPDAAFSMDRGEFAAMVRDVRQAEACLGTLPGDGRDVWPQDESPERPGRQWGRSIYVSRPIAKGEAFTRENTACVRPGYSLHPRHYEELLQRRAERDYEPGERIKSRESRVDLEGRGES